MWGGSKRKGISTRTADRVGDMCQKGFIFGLGADGCDPPNMFMDLVDQLLTKRPYRTDSAFISALVTMEVNTITWWITQNGEMLKALIEQHEQEYEDDANRTTSELLGQLGKNKGSSTPDPD